MKSLFLQALQRGHDSFLKWTLNSHAFTRSRKKPESQSSDQTRKSTIVRKASKTRSSYVLGAPGTGMVREKVSIIEHLEISAQKNERIKCP